MRKTRLPNGSSLLRGSPLLALACGLLLAGCSGEGNSGTGTGADAGSATGRVADKTTSTVTGTGTGTGSGTGTATVTGIMSSSGTGSGTGTGMGTGTIVGTSGPSCLSLAATCGPSGNENCCTSLLVPGGTFNRGNDPMSPATVNAFSLDKYEVTVGRFRAFVSAGMGTQTSPPAAGAGIHPLVDGSGWNSAWSGNLAASTAALKTAVNCGSARQTWTDAPAGNESRPMNCMDWYEAFAFCAWDGGRLPTEAEWNCAAAGGSEQRVYPWGATAPNATLAVYDCQADGVSSCAFTDILPAGSKPTGNGRWGQSDLAGSLWEWNLDGYSTTHTSPCSNCAETAGASTRVIRGGCFFNPASGIKSTARYYGDQLFRDVSVGVRCARSAP